jgi:hypothetical protein
MRLYLDEEIWNALSIRARRLRAPISELIRQAVEEKYAPRTIRSHTMQAVVGLWKDRSDLPDTDSDVRRLRKGKQLTSISSRKLF